MRRVAAIVAVAWFDDHFHRIELEALGERRFHLQYHGSLAVSELLDAALQHDPYADIRWSTSASGDNASRRPW